MLGPRLYVSYGLMAKHELRAAKVRAGDQEADYWLQIACIVSGCTRVNKHFEHGSLSGGLKRELRAEAVLTW